MPSSPTPPDTRRSRQTIVTNMGFFGEEEIPVEVAAEDTELGEVRVDLTPRPLNYQSPGETREATTAYLTPVDAAIFGHQLIESSRRATQPPKDG